MNALRRLVLVSPVFLFVPPGGASAARQAPAPLEWVRVAEGGRGFVLSPSGRPFVPWGFNYDHDREGRLIEDYWASEWSKVEEDFLEMRELGANVARIHLQVGKFMRGPEAGNPEELERLSRLVALAERTGLYLDLTGLGCYRKTDVPEWYDRLSEEERWAAQARFWEEVAARCAASPAVFCYDLMNEPVVPGGRRKPGDWLGPPFGGYHYVQCITLDQGERPRPEVARRWTARLVQAVRKRDPRRLVTVGLVPWSLDRPGLTSGFVPEKVAPELDFVSVHIYPESSKVSEALEELKGFDCGKPVVIEEMFPLKCSMEEFRRFLDGSRKTASGWVGFYWGKTLSEYRSSTGIVDSLMAGWLELFRQGPPAPPAAAGSP